LFFVGVVDDGGLEGFIWVGGWIGLGGFFYIVWVCFDIYRWAAGIAALSNQISFFTSSNLPTVHPLFSDKQAVTIDLI
ncbi:LLM class flavin-dependent oxidoreductase, partial [Pseudomonas syringae pv. tagetis]